MKNYKENIEYYSKNFIYTRGDKGAVVFGKNLQKEFTLVFEIGCTQKDAICEIILIQFPNAKLQCEKDFSDRNRYIFANIINFE